MTYDVDLRDLKFQLLEWLPTAELLAAERFAEWDVENVSMVVDEAVRIARDELAPVNEEGDRTGTRWEAGRVTMPESFKPAYRTLAEGGWLGATSNPELGGMGLPEVVGTAVSELFAGANMSLSLSILLTRGASHLIEQHGGDELKGLMCEKMYSGEWGGTMCLTEPHAGSDVGASTTRAIRQADRRYLIQGEKIFITFGEHDLTDNIVHTVLARTPDAPAGTRGLSLFAVPKIRVGADGRPGEANDVYCSGVEHKLGIHASPTCSLVFGQRDACEGFLLGQECDGMRLMFQMMNAARIEVGVQATAVAGAAHQAALAYARERLQMRHWAGGKGGAAQVPIVEHPDVRRMLLTSSAYVQAMRALILKASLCHDLSRVTSGEERERYRALLEVLTPICKAWPSDWGFRVTEWCLQVFGGYGYTRDYPAEQYLRDAKITSIYEGTNGIQALDFVGRKLRSRAGAVRELLAGVAATARELADDGELGGPARLLGAAASEVGEILQQVPGRDGGPLTMVLNAVPFTDMFGTLLGAGFLLEQAALARARLAALCAEKGVDAGDRKARRKLLADNPDAAFLHNKVQSAICFGYRALPSVTAQGVAMRAGETSPMDAVM